MADLADIAAEQNEAAEAAALTIRRPVGPPPKVVGVDKRGKPVAWACLNCDQVHDTEIRWCDSLCREDWERVQSANKRNGVSGE